MISPQLTEKFQQLKLSAAMSGYEQIAENHDIERELLDKALEELLDIQLASRFENSQRLARKNAALKWPQAMLENLPINDASPFSLDDIQVLGSCEWVVNIQNILLIGASGLGKTTAASAVGNGAINKGFKVKFLKYSHLIKSLVEAELNGDTDKYIKKLNRMAVLIVDDWGLTPLTDEERLLLFNLVEEREGNGSWVITSQFDVGDWHKAVGEQYIGDSIFDRIGHTKFKYTFEQGSDSFRKINAQQGGKNANK
ncbi:ATPase [Shewanella piezotolerans WP3]|uniref:ATPase n=1 Tax=Shewanella piezotolerans (strain WP3 / JCM 13877) TaxID=225849 RepID=B8CMQ7_SHEPW|nr:ATP-binding protein [Shewanella piezotolerans]ACJ29447.1 ATPase [Shewanella piezotolerans WP3]